MMNREMTTQENEKQVMGEEQTRAGRAYVPKVDIAETSDALWLWADMPGVDENSVSVRLDKGTLSIEGEVSLEEYRELTPVYTEYNVGNFTRSFRLSEDIDPESIQAKMTHGVLELKLGKRERAQPQRIDVTRG
jgi:HSP20 family molecular chaperone IbpA